MSKLAAQDKFLDLSDYGRSFGTMLANLKNTRFTPIHVTLLLSFRLIAIYCILENFYLAGFFIVLKSGIDATRELARIKKHTLTPGA
jgi:hypothetical protein